MQCNVYTVMESLNTQLFSHQTNGLMEQFNWILSWCLAKLIGEDQQNWDEKTLFWWDTEHQANHPPNTLLTTCSSNNKCGYQLTVSYSLPILANQLMRGTNSQRVHWCCWKTLLKHSAKGENCAQHGLDHTPSAGTWAKGSKTQLGTLYEKRRTSAG